MQLHLLNRYFPWLLVGIIAINAGCFFSEIMEGDGILYANISRRIADTNEWMNLFVEGKDWLDKPHLPFWITAVSFKIFGFSAFAYKLPGFLFYLISLLFTYKLTRLIYNIPTAQAATIIFGSALHVVLAGIDLRAELFLTAFIVMATYYMVKAHYSNKLSHFLLCAFASAGAILTKGLFVMITIAAGYFIFVIATKQWRVFLNYKWYLYLAFCAIFITPELYALYVQFDLHPEKIVFGRQQVSGIKFFLWDSQFGRFFNTGPIKGKGEPLFFIHTTAWAFVPWTFILCHALIIKAKQWKPTPGWIVSFAALVTFLLFSASRFQLPHYIVIILPHLAILCADFLLRDASPKMFRLHQYVMDGLIVLSLVAIVALSVISKLGLSYILIACCLIIAGFFLLRFRTISLTHILLKAVGVVLVLFSYLSLFFYPALMQYQAGEVAATDYNKTGNKAPVHFYDYFSRSFEAYSNQAIIYIEKDSSLHNVQFPALFYTTETTRAALDSMGYNTEIIKAYPYYHITKLTAGFLNAKTRNNYLKKHLLLQVSKP